MRIVQVLHGFLPVHQAGSELYTYHLARELQARNYVALFCREDGPAGEPVQEVDETYDGIPVHRIYLNPRGRSATPWNRFLSRYRNPAVEACFDRFLDSVRPDVVHVQHLHRLSGGVIALARRRGLPVVVTLHDFWFVCHTIQLLRPDLARCSGPLGGWRCPGCAELAMGYPWRFALSPATVPLFLHRTSYLRRCLEMADAVLSPSAFVRDTLERNGFPQGRIRVVDYGTADAWLSGYRPAPAERLRFGFVGSVMRHKGVHTLIEAFNRLDDPRAELHIFGDPGFDPAYYAQMEALAKVPGIQFRGRFENTHIADVLCQVDVLVVPSIWYENSPITIHEARLAGLPVIGSSLGGIPELVTDGVSGLLFRAGDEAELCAQMRRLLDEPGLLARLRHGVQPVQSMRDHAADLEVLYRQLIEARASERRRSGHVHAL